MSTNSMEDASWRTLKTLLHVYVPVQITPALQRSMVNLENAMEKGIRDVNNPTNLKDWLTKMMHNSCDLHILLASIQPTNRTFTYHNMQFDIKDVVGTIVDKIEILYEIRNDIDLAQLKMQFTGQEPVSHRSRTPSPTPDAPSSRVSRHGRGGGYQRRTNLMELLDALKSHIY